MTGGHFVVIITGFIRSKEGYAAVDRAMKEARLRGAKLIVVHSSRGGAREEVEDVVADRGELERIASELTDAGVEHEIREVVHGNAPADDILEVAHDSGADLIVIGLRRRSPVGKLILGSNAQDILLRSDCAVLAVKPAHG